MRVIIVIPARYKSSRFPGKALTNLLGKPMIQWVAELSAKVVGQENVFVATDDVRISNCVEKLGYRAIMTSESCLTGTDRLAEVASKVEADIYINVQGDEPLVDPKDIEKIIQTKIENPYHVINGYAVMGKEEDPNNCNIPKVIFTEDKRLVYMSRKALPGFKSKDQNPKAFFKQVCIYAFSKQELFSFANFGRKSFLEYYEDIEIIRFFEWNQVIKLVETSRGSLAVDVPGDFAAVEIALRDTWCE